MAVWHAIKGQQKYLEKDASKNPSMAFLPPIFSIENRVLVAENVEVDMETLRIARSSRAHSLTRCRAQETIVEAVIKGFYPEDRKQFEAYERGDE